MLHSTRRHTELYTLLQRKIKTLHDTLWERQGDWVRVNAWATQFAPNQAVAEDERLHALYLLSNFLYFGSTEIRALLESLFRDLFRPHIAQLARRAAGGTRDPAVIGPRLTEELQLTRFVSLGKHSESSSMLLYSFRQVNSIPVDLFVEKNDIFNGFINGRPTGLACPDVRHYVFVDDMCGSGHQGAEYSREVALPIQRLSGGKATTYYYALFGLKNGINYIRQNGYFSDVRAVIEMDESFQAFSDLSRFYSDTDLPFDKTKAKTICHKYGSLLCPGFPLGYGDCQLLLGFHHNTPDNTLPIFWADQDAGQPWTPIFKRFAKVGLP